MQRPNVNVVVFDEDQSFVTSQSRNNYTRRQTQPDGLAASHSPQLINNQISQLNQKIANLQEKANKIQQLTKGNPNSSALSDISSSVNNNSANPNQAQVEQLLRVVEFKIQVIIDETKKIVQRMTTQFDKKISKISSQKGHEVSSVAKIQQHCRSTIAKVEQSYQDELGIIRSEHLHLEKRLIQRVEEIQVQYKKKLREFQNKEQEYVATIGHLQNKLKASLRNKKMIEVTQERPTSSRPIDQSENMSQLSSQQFGSSNALSNNDTSKRRTRIFNQKSSNRSTSPNNQVLSPLKIQNNSKKQTQSLAKKPQQPKPAQALYQTKVEHPQVPSQYQPKPSPVYISYNEEPRAGQVQHMDPIKTSSTMQAPYPRPQTQASRSIRSHQQQLIKNTSKQFFKDAPKVQWEKFQDFNELESSGSEEDVFFYTDQNRQARTGIDNNDSGMHSPFDLK